MTVSRRELLKRLMAASGAALGIGFATSTTRRDTPEDTLSLTGRGFRLAAADGKRSVPRRGDRHLGRGELIDQIGEVVGHFYATSFGMESPGQVAGATPSSLQFHTLQLPDGTIMGVGAASLDPSAVDTFAIVGGTGRFAGVRGTYTAELQHVELGGDGSGRFSFSFAT